MLTLAGMTALVDVPLAEKARRQVQREGPALPLRMKYGFFGFRLGIDRP